MNFIETILLILLVINSLAMVGLVLLQQSKGADVGAAFGSGTAGAMFGPTGGTSFLVKITSLLAVLFFVLTFSLAFIAHQRAQDIRGFDFAESVQEEVVPDIGVDAVPGDDLPALEIGDDLPDIGIDTPIQVEGSSPAEDEPSEEAGL